MGSSYWFVVGGRPADGFHRTTVEVRLCSQESELLHLGCGSFTEIHLLYGGIVIECAGTRCSLKYRSAPAGATIDEDRRLCRVDGDQNPDVSNISEPSAPHTTGLGIALALNLAK
jgi:hypothetical protein